jgi:hypothetical protein
VQALLTAITLLREAPICSPALKSDKKSIRFFWGARDTQQFCVQYMFCALALPTETKTERKPLREAPICSAALKSDKKSIRFLGGARDAATLIPIKNMERIGWAYTNNTSV